MHQQPGPALHQTTRTEITSLFGEAKLVLDETPKANPKRGITRNLLLRFGSRVNDIFTGQICILTL